MMIRYVTTARSFHGLICERRLRRNVMRRDLSSSMFPTMQEMMARAAGRKSNRRSRPQISIMSVLRHREAQPAPGAETLADPPLAGKLTRLRDRTGYADSPGSDH